jgi:hypothetical protein
MHHPGAVRAQLECGVRVSIADPSCQTLKHPCYK